MSAVAINPQDMQTLQGLQKSLKLRSKSQVIHLALETLNASLERERLAVQISQSVKKCAAADIKENGALTNAAALHTTD